MEVEEVEEEEADEVEVEVVEEAQEVQEEAEEAAVAVSPKTLLQAMATGVITRERGSRLLHPPRKHLSQVLTLRDSVRRLAGR